MTEFRVSRGHDGPARAGEYIIEAEVYSTPILAGPTSFGRRVIPYETLGRASQPAEGPRLLALPFELSSDKLQQGMTVETDSFLLPSMPAFSTLDDAAGILLLQHQLNFLRQVSPEIASSRVIVRVPDEISPESFSSYLHEFHSMGVRAAAFTFDGLLGKSDFNSIRLRARLPMSWLAVALGRISPAEIPLIYYMGFDIIDIGHAQEAAIAYQRLWHNGSEIIKKDHPFRYCPCPNCQGIETADLSKTTSLLLKHNIDMYTSVLSESFHSMNTGRLRWLVESSTHNSPAHASLLRKVNQQLYSFIEEFTPTSGDSIVALIGPESYSAPSVRRFREFIADRYSPPSGKRIALLLPCSARKPYSDSKSHRKFLETIEDSLGNSISSLAQIILTSPLGVVPRELERVFPAANYDLPVTGDWDAEEIDLAADALATHLGKFPSSLVVIAHVSGGYKTIVETAESRISQTIIYTSSERSPTSWEAREALQETLIDMKNILSLKDSRPQELEEIIRATADFQFGHGAGNLLVPELARLAGKSYRQIICRIDKEQICSYIADAGLLSLTLDGAKRLVPLNHYWVRLDAPSVKGGSIFAVGVREADSIIRPGDEVIVLNDHDEVTAVGRSEMSGREMCELERGRAVSIRHKVG